MLDKILIGSRIKEVREKKYNETRQEFAERCGLTDSNLGRIERGERMISINALEKICKATGTESDYILFGKCNNKNLSIRRTIDNYLNKSSKEELKIYFKLISTFNAYIELNK